MNGTKILAGEFVIAVGFYSWGMFKQGYYPWPPSVIRIGIVFALLGLMSLADDKFAAVLGGGFLLAMLMKIMSSQGGISNWKPEGSTTDPLANPKLWYMMEVG